VIKLLSMVATKHRETVVAMDFIVSVELAKPTTLELLATLLLLVMHLSNKARILVATTVPANMFMDQEKLVQLTVTVFSVSCATIPCALD